MRTRQFPGPASGHVVFDPKTLGEPRCQLCGCTADNAWRTSATATRSSSSARASRPNGDCTSASRARGWCAIAKCGERGAHCVPVPDEMLGVA